MIRFGPAGIPLSCKGRTLRDGIADVHHLGLTAMEVQFIKVNPLTRLALDEEVGKLARELVQQLTVSLGPAGPAESTPTAEAFAAPHPPAGLAHGADMEPRKGLRRPRA